MEELFALEKTDEKTSHGGLFINNAPIIVYVRQTFTRTSDKNLRIVLDNLKA